MHESALHYSVVCKTERGRYDFRANYRGYYALMLLQSLARCAWTLNERMCAF